MHLFFFFMKHKSNIQRLLQSFITFAYTQFYICVKVVQTNTGTKFLSMRQFFLDHDIETNIHVSIPSNKTGWLSANTIISSQLRDLFFINLIYLFVFWGDCVLTVVYLINCLPSLIMSDKTLFQLLYNQVPFVTHLSIFGNLCYTNSESSKTQI